MGTGHWTGQVDKLDRENADKSIDDWTRRLDKRQLPED